MKRLIAWLLVWTLLAPAAFAQDPLEGVVPLVQDDLAAVAKIRTATGKHALLYFGDQRNCPYCRHTVGALQQPEVRAVWSKHFVGAHADLSELLLDDDDPGHAMLARHNPKKWIPLLIFLDASGKEVARHVGQLRDKNEALLLARFVSERHYLKTEWKIFRVAEAQ